MVGCYRTNTRGEMRDAGLADARSVDAWAVDAWAVDARMDVGPSDAGADGSECACIASSDCPPPPPSWNCLLPECLSCVCTFRMEPSLCGPGAVCDALGDCRAVPMDAFVPALDVGPRPDAFVVPVDAGPRPDAFVAPVDAGPGPDAFVAPSSDALRFATDDQMTVPDRPGLSVGPDLTLEMWVRLRSGGILAIKGERSVASHLYLEALPPVGDTFRTFWLGWSVRGERVMVVVDRPVPRDVWTHFALVQRGTSAGRVEIELFVDGESTGVFDAGEVGSYVGSFNSAPLIIGRADADLDEIRLWRVARTRAAIQAFMRTELDPGARSGLVAYWPLDGVGQVVLDRSLNGNDGFRGVSPADDGADPGWIADGAF